MLQFLSILTVNIVTRIIQSLYYSSSESADRGRSIIQVINIAAMLLNLDPDMFRSGPRLHSTCSKQFSSFIVFLNNKIIMC